MSKITIILIVVGIIAGGAIFYSLGESATYATFEEAKKNPDREYHVVGKLNLEKEMMYNPAVNANLFTFYMVDNDGKECKVLYNNVKPQDFERSEQVVIIGKMENSEFMANKILMKCPSKYNDTKQAQNI